MNYSIATISISGTLEQKMVAISEAGFQGIEIFENDLITSKKSPTEIGRLAQSLGLKICAYQPFRDFEGLPNPLRQNAFDRAEKKFDLMQELDAELLMICSSVHSQAKAGISQISEDLYELAVRADKRNLKIAYEALSWSPIVWDYRDAWEAVRRADHQALGICLDTFHIFSRQCDLGQIANIPPEKIFLVQIADAPKLAMDPMSWSRHHRCFPGQGQLPLNSFMTLLKASGYNDLLSLEIFNDQFRSSDPFKTANDGYRSLTYLNQASEHSNNLKLDGLPEIGQPTGIEFIEFAVSDIEHVQLSNVLTGLGFTLNGLHKAKNVERWTQGQINLVFNREDGSFAHRYHDEHGLSVCAYGIAIKRPAGLVERANKLGYTIAYGDPEKDTHGLASIEGPGGPQLYFVNPDEQSPHWDREFVEQCPRPSKNYLTRVDHVATSMNFDEALQAALLYKSLFELVPTEAVNVTDPSGLVRSLVFENRSRSLALTINSTGSQETVQGRIQRTYSGSGVNHIAFETPSIFDVAESLWANSVPIMNTTDNYYEDLNSRFNINEEYLARMKKLHILYDEDEYGCFHQIYTQLIQGRFCFEIVQRDGYQGYGMPNAQLRMTMQALELDQIDAQ